MKLIKSGVLNTNPGREEWFTGQVMVKMLFEPIPGARTGGAEVVFQPGARTAWHTHPLGQTLLITEGKGWVQIEGQQKQEVKAGDVVQFQPGEKHWHGATDKDQMSHIAIQESLEGKAIDWLEHVEDNDYLSQT